MHKYTIIIEKAGNNYSAHCPDLPGCIASGPTVEETSHKMKQAIKFHIEGLKGEKMDIPESTTEATSIEIAT